VVILDNLTSHKTKAEAVLKRRGAWFHFLSPYSPDLNRDGLRQAQGPSQTHQRKNHRCPLRVVGDICSLYSQQECWSYLKDAGYRPIERSGSIEPLADPGSERSFTLGLVSEDWKPGCKWPSASNTYDLRPKALAVAAATPSAKFLYF
jgi:hypothetical protein